MGYISIWIFYCNLCKVQKTGSLYLYQFIVNHKESLLYLPSSNTAYEYSNIGAYQNVVSSEQSILCSMGNNSMNN